MLVRLEKGTLHGPLHTGKGRAQVIPVLWSHLELVPGLSADVTATPWALPMGSATSARVSVSANQESLANTVSAVSGTTLDSGPKAANVSGAVALTHPDPSPQDRSWVGTSQAES